MKKTPYKTPERLRLAMKARYEANKASRGKEFLAEMAEWKRAWRAAGGSPTDKSRHRLYKDRKKRRTGNPLTRLVRRALNRAQRAGLEATITKNELHWPTHCPVLGIELDYATPRGKRVSHAPNLPSLDRWDNTKGYVAGNVFVISLRANQLKGNATPAELQALARYAAECPGALSG